MNPICFNSWVITNVQASVESEIAAETVEKGPVREHIFLELCYIMIF